ncbi:MULTISPECIES: hypothetical protein [unclassified Bradyrhizobium]|uniref:hypothetical protein n=1 Tax=unclassified Bradyrhizobium TaxID=2631580 RepID=UPI001FFB1986|nr:MULTISPECIES: hypothetical protein [unclassified Bradyrhizobium]MCK1710684.1 hypothetical protein [Bradyrhizobium sp. 143]MCK1724363.1 hypothetical protein [Bradyrhizobium sp. 142]
MRNEMNHLAESTETPSFVRWTLCIIASSLHDDDACRHENVARGAGRESLLSLDLCRVPTAAALRIDPETQSIMDETYRILRLAPCLVQQHPAPVEKRDRLAAFKAAGLSFAMIANRVGKSSGYFLHP